MDEWSASGFKDLESPTEVPPTLTIFNNRGVANDMVFRYLSNSYFSNFGHWTTARTKEVMYYYSHNEENSFSLLGWGHPPSRLLQKPNSATDDPKTKGHYILVIFTDKKGCKSLHMTCSLS